MKEYAVRIKNKGAPDSEAWEEKIPIPEESDPIKFMEDLVQKYNDEEDRRKKYVNKKYVIRYREFVGIVGDTGEKGRELCDTFKVNNVTLMATAYAYDLYKCKNCGMIRKRIGFDDLPPYQCKPDQTCTECNIVFSSPGHLKRHNLRGKHSRPEWLHAW